MSIFRACCCCCWLILCAAVFQVGSESIEFGSGSGFSLQPSISAFSSSAFLSSTAIAPSASIPSLSPTPSPLSPFPSPFPSPTTPGPVTPPTIPPTLSQGPVFEPNITTYGNNTCEVFHANGSCANVLLPFPEVITNLSRSIQTEATGSVEAIIEGLASFMAPEHCFLAAIPLLCRYSFPTCDPAYRVPTYQPVCRRDCEIVRDFLCRDPWEEMLRLLSLLNFDYLDTPDCDPLENPEAGEAPMCISTLNKDFIPLPLLTGTECYSGLGRGYQGNVSVTETGKTCQSWDMSYPQQHLLSYEGYPELSGGHNYCRNPGERGERPWCFTTDRGTRWEYCDIPQCAAGPMCVPHGRNVCRREGTVGMDWIYIDTRTTDQDDLGQSMETFVEHTGSGLYTPPCVEILNEYMCVSNFPSCDLSHSEPRPIRPCQAFCRRVNEVCGDQIRGLTSFTGILGELTAIFDCDTLPTPNGGESPECYQQTRTLPGRNIAISSSSSTSTCYNKSDNGVSYHGDMSVTSSGKTCQAWVSQTPHPHPITPLDRPELEQHNHCRNPDRRGLSPWCYTTDPNTRWEYCDIQSCDAEPMGENQPALPLYSFVIIGIGAPLLLIIITMAIAAFCCCCCCRGYKEIPTNPKMMHVDGLEKGKEEKMVDSVVLTSAKRIKGDITDNPLYAVNPLNQVDQSVEYEGVHLPQVSRDDIFYIKDLGQGHFGVVVQAEVAGVDGSKERSVVAIKVLKEGASSQAKKEFFREATLMDTFQHPNILRLIGVCIDQEPLCMIFEFMELGDLNNFLRQNSPNRFNDSSLNRSGSLSRTAQVKSTLNIAQLVCISVDIASGLDYLAQNHFVHRDLATRNCLVSRNLRVKISDFGLSQDVYTTDYFKMGDSELLPIRWMPPEAILYAKFTTQSDVWSFGVVLWEIFSYGIQPYFSMTNEEVVHHVRGGNVMSHPEGCPREIYDLMIDCWAMDPKERPTAGEIYLGLQRWSPDISAGMGEDGEEKPQPPDYQNMSTVREYVEGGPNGGVAEKGGDGKESVGGQFELSMTGSSADWNNSTSATTTANGTCNGTSDQVTLV